MKESWEEFRYSHIETGWFDDNRSKTLKAMRRLWERVPQDDLDKLPADTLVFAPSPSKNGELLPWYTPPGVERNGVFIYLAPQLEKLSQGAVDSVVAQEFAHAILDHNSPDLPGLPPDQVPAHVKDWPHEKQADALIVQWGYQPAYRRRRRRAK